MSPRRPPLTRERIIEAALHLVDAQGLRRLTMRRLGDALEVEAMAIYHHLPRGKEQLLDALVGHVADHPVRRETPLSGPAAGERLREWAHAYRARLVAHSGVLPLLLTRRNSTAVATTTASLRDLLTASGTDDATAEATAHALISYVIGHCANEVRVRHPVTAESTDWDVLFDRGLDLVLPAAETS